MQESLKRFVYEILPDLQEKLSSLTDWIYYLFSIINFSELELQKHAKIYLMHKKFTKVVEENVATSHICLKKFQKELVVSIYFFMLFNKIIINNI